MNVETVWDDFSEGLHRYVRARVPSDADADDIMQDVFVKVLDRKAQLRDSERLAGWVFRIASNAVADHHRAKEPAVVGPLEPTTDEGKAHELASCVRPFVEMLEEPYRSALIWTDLEGMTQREAAERAGISVSGMKSRVQRGRRQLRELFERCCEIELDARNRVVGYEPRCGCGPDAAHD